MCLPKKEIDSIQFPSPLMGEGWGEGESSPFLSPSPYSPPAWGGEFLRLPSSMSIFEGVKVIDKNRKDE
jgi:hypothetical protein